MISLGGLSKENVVHSSTLIVVLYLNKNYMPVNKSRRNNIKSETPVDNLGNLRKKFYTAMRATRKCAAGQIWPAGPVLRTAGL